ncbi:hypothetical protein WJX72_000751 [[Myrmecia] bisecta]|uniref:Uncharacterized protein n=1 Tax=[Myrmecia] bisecta TaxID=41462 RepID=A0AAW1PS25_9CHLO
MGEQGQAAGARTDLHMVVEALRANRDRATNLSGLAQLHKLLKGLNGHEVLQAYLEQSPTCTELQAIWDVQLSVNDHSITIALLQLLARMLQMPLANQPVLSADTATALDQLAHDVIARRLKAIYFNLGSDMRDRMVATLQLMAALAKRSTAAARELVQAFDFELPAFYKASLPPREQRDAPADQAQQWRRLWQHKDPLKRPTCSAFVDFAHALLASCNTALLAMVLPIRPLFAGWLNCLAQHPSASATATVRLLLDKVLVDDGSIPPHLQAEPFSITALTQLAQLSGQEDSESDAATAASQAAHDLLMALCTDPAHGLCPADRADSTEAEGRAADASLSGRSSASGRRRLLQLMQKLRATELSRHAQLLMAIAGRHPSMAAAFLAVAPYSLEPQLSVRWLATATLVGRLVEAAAAGAAPGFLQRAQRGERPPFMDSGAVRQLLRNLFPPCLTKAALSHGIQHSSPLVRYTTLCLLLRIFHTAEHALTDLNAALEAAAATPGQAATPLHPGAIAADVAQDNVTVPATPKVLFAAAHSQLTNAQEPGGRHTEGPATAFHLEAPWRGFSTRLRSAVRAYLPDPQALLSQFSAMHAAAVKEAASRPASQPAADVATEPSLKPPKLSKQAAMKQGPGATLGVQQAGMEAAEATQLDLEQRSMGPEHSSEAEGSERDGEMPPDECQSMSADDADFMEVGDGHSDSDTNEAERTEWRHAAQADAADLALAKLLGVLTAYQQLLPDAMGDSRFDAGRLLTQDVLSLSPQAVGCEGNPSETALWLGLLPACPPEDSAEERRCGEAVQSFLAEAVALVARRPHELHELTQSLLQPGALPAVLGFSPLAVCCLRQVLKVAESARLPASARAATAAYVSGVLSALLQLQADPHPLALVILLVVGEAESAAQLERLLSSLQDAGISNPLTPSDLVSLKTALSCAPAPAVEAACGREGGLTSLQEALVTSLKPVPTAQRAVAVRALVLQIRLPRISQPLQPDQLVVLFQLLEHTLQDKQADALACALELRALLAAYLVDDSAADADCIMNRSITQLLSSLLGITSQDGSASAVKEDQEREGGEDGRGSQEFGDLAQFAVCCMKTLGRIFKLGDRSEAEEALQRQLMQYLDTCIGDSLAALPNALRETPAFTQLAADVSSFATAVMRARVADAACVKCLRRLLAALLPSAASEEEGTDVGQAQQPGEGAGHAGLDEPNSTADIASGADASEMSNGDTDSNTDASEPVGGGVVNAEVSAIAGQVLGRLVSHSQFVAILLRPQAMALPALPPAAAKLLLPLTSILPAVDCELPGPGQAAPALAAKREIAELMETLLDLQESFADASQPPDLATQARALLPLLLSAYHATSTATDRALLRVMYVMDRQCRQAEQGETEGKSEVGEAAARLDGPLACAGFLFGEAARRAHEKGLLFPQVQHAPDDLTAQRQRVVEEHGALDARRMALATVHFLEHRTLAADELDPHDSVPQAGAAQHDADSSMALSASRCDAAYDPAFMLPFAVQALRTGLLTCQQLATNGLLSLCLRTLATEDPGLRGLAYEALAAALEALDREDFRAQAQMAMLLSCVRLSVTQPFQRLPAVAAVFLAEAAMQLLHPGSAMYPALNKLLLRKPAVDVQDVPLMYQLLMSGSQQHWLERCWLLRLLQAGLRSDLDAQIYRRRFVVELLMTVHDSALADSSVRDLAMGAICAVARAPAYAQDLAKKAGLLPWLASAAGKALIGDCTAISSHAQSTTEAPPALHNAFIEPGSARTSAAAAQLLQVLQRLP